MKILYSGFKGIMHSANGGYNKVTYNNVNKTVLYSEDQPLGRFFLHQSLVSHPKTDFRVQDAYIEIQTRHNASILRRTHMHKLYSL